MTIRKNLLLTGLLAAAALASGCLNPLMFKRGAYTMDDWDTWTSWNDAYGSHEVTPDGVYYRLTPRQDDTRDTPSDGYSPGLILSRELMGDNWTVDLRADFDIPPGQVKRFSFGIWAGGDASRPSLGNASAVMKIVAQRQNGPRPGDDALIMFSLPGGRPYAVPLKAKVLRFARSGPYFSAAYSLNGRKFTPLLTAEAPPGQIPSQKFFIGGFAAGPTDGAYARLTSLKINGREVLR